METRPPLPPFNPETAAQKVRIIENMWVVAMADGHLDAGAFSAHKGDCRVRRFWVGICGVNHTSSTGPIRHRLRGRSFAIAVTRRRGFARGCRRSTGRSRSWARSSSYRASSSPTATSGDGRGCAHHRLIAMIRSVEHRPFHRGWLALGTGLLCFAHHHTSRLIALA